MASVNLVVKDSGGNVVYGAPVNFQEPRTMIATNSFSGTSWKRMTPIDTQVTISLGVDVSKTFSPTQKPFARKGFWLVDINGVYPNPLPSYAIGVSTKQNWTTLEPTAGAYDFSAWINVLKSLQGQGKKGCLSVWTGTQTPTWLYGAPYNVSSVTTTLTAGGSVTVPLHWTGSYESRWQMLMQAAYNAANTAGVLDTVAYVKMTMATNTTAEMRWPSEYGGYVSGTEVIMKNAGWRPTLVSNSIVRMMNATAAIWGISPAYPLFGLDAALSSEYFMVPHIDDSGNIGQTQKIFTPIYQQMLALAGFGASAHSDAIGLASPSDGIDSLLIPFVDTGTIGGQTAEKNYGWPQCTPGLKPNCPWSPHPGGRPLGTCDVNGYEATIRYAKGQGGKFIEIFGGATTCYPETTLALATEFNWLPGQ